MPTEPAPLTPSSYDVMISYCWQDSAIAREVADELDARGFSIWIDIQKMHGDINASMIDAILSSKVVIAFISDGYCKSANCLKEIEFANEKKKTIVPVRLSHSKEVTSSIPAFITTGKLYFDLSPPIWADPQQRRSTAENLITHLTQFTGKAPTLVTPEPVKSGKCFPPIPIRKDPENFIDRSDLWETLDARFSSERLCILRGVGGSGKTYAAIKYAHQKLREGHHVSWFRADSPDNLRADAVQYAVFAGLPDPEKLSPANLFAQIASLHAADGAQPRLIVLDNVERYADVEDVIASHAESGVTAVRFLATTRRALREGGAVAPLPAVSVDFPDDEKCAAYLRRLPGRTVLPEDAVRIVRQCGNLPLRVSVAARYLVKRPDVTVDAYLSRVEGAKLRRADGGGDAADEIYPEISLSIDTLSKESSPGHVLLMLMALLHPDNIILSIVAEWPKTKDGSFARAVDALLDLNLISSGYEGKTASIHRCIQADVRERVQVGSVKSQSRGLADFYLAALKQKDRLLDAIKKGNAGEIDVFIRDKPVLDLSHLHLGDKAVVMLVPSLSASLTLHTLDLTGNDLSHVSIVSLAESVRKMPLLHTLILRMNRIGPVGSAALASCLGTQSTLRKLNIRQNELQSDGATALATALLSNTSLEVLDISMNGITSDGAQAIWEALASNTTLKKLRTEGNELAEQALSKLITSEKLSLEEVSHSSPTLDSKILHARMSVTCTTRFINADAITSRFVSKISSVTPSASSSGWDD